MLYNDEIAEKTAEFLLQIKAIKLNNANPFTWVSGWKSPIYCDNRKTLSFPIIRTYLRHEMSKIIQDEFEGVDVVAGVATGGIALGALVAQELGKPFVYVRSSAKAHGLENKVEGLLETGQSVVVIEDLISTGKSSLNAVKALRNEGCKVKGMVAIFSYGFQKAIDSFKDEDCKLYTLSDYDTLLKHAKENDYIKKEDMASLAKWREDPANWG
ncbi:MAG: orotate phosphoribosyltransferase [Bacteroidales bacterium]|nr:orotate phosphoribosyltransferase [Bacteroidales bacterium]MCF8327368.1 orotate phosphoribosyltransferase [Bacteroidales bacterium]